MTNMSVGLRAERMLVAWEKKIVSQVKLIYLEKAEGYAITLLFRAMRWSCSSARAVPLMIMKQSTSMYVQYGHVTQP